MAKTVIDIQSAEISAAEGARRLGLTAQAIGMWVKRPGAPARVDGRRVMLVWPSFARWREQMLADQAVAEATRKLREQLASRQASPDGTPMERLTAANARKAEIEVELLERSSVRVVDAEALFAKHLTDLRAQLLPFPRTAAPKLLSAKTIIEMERVLDAEVHRLMETIAETPELTDTQEEQAA